MIPKLYAPDGATLLAWLPDATVCEVTEERNGIFELYLEIPTASDQYPLIENDCFIKAKPRVNVRHNADLTARHEGLLQQVFNLLEA